MPLIAGGFPRKHHLLYDDGTEPELTKDWFAVGACCETALVAQLLQPVAYTALRGVRCAQCTHLHWHVIRVHHLWSRRLLLYGSGHLATPNSVHELLYIG